MTDEPFPFVVGVARSGTTLLRAMLASHPDLAIPEEANFRLSMSVDHRRYERSDGLDLEAFVSDLCQDRNFQWWGLSDNEVRAALREAAPQSFSDAMRALFRHCARKEGKTRYGDKTPEAVMVLPRFARLFPEARFIHLIRDGRNVALSHVNTESFIRNVGEVAVHWKKRIERGQGDGTMLGPERYREVRYEQLVEDPEAVLRSLCEYIELDFHPSMLRYFERPMEALGSTQQDLPFHRSIYMPPTRGLRDWRKQMSRNDLEIFEGIAGDLLERLGYERSVPSITPRMYFRAGLVRAYVASEAQAKRRMPALARGYRFARRHLQVRR